MDRNLKELLSAFNQKHVKYVIIGGYAVFVHAQPRLTKDLDVFIESSESNASAVFSALTAFGAPLQNFSVRDFYDGRTVARFGVPPICFEVIQTISGVSFSEVFANSKESVIDGELQVRYISAEDLVKNKLASGRSQDLADVEAILHRQRALRKTE